MARSAKMPSMAKIQKLLGGKVDPNSLMEIKRPPLPKNQALTTSLMMEATLNSLAYPDRARVSKTCKNELCAQVFYTEYRYLSYCSDDCRRAVLAKDYGIEVAEDFYHGRNEIQIWGGRVPAGIIPPEVLSVMKYLVENAEKNQGQSIQPWLPPAKPKPSSATVSKKVEKPKPKVVEIRDLDDLLSDIPKLDSLSELLID